MLNASLDECLFLSTAVMRKNGSLVQHDKGCVQEIVYRMQPHESSMHCKMYAVRWTCDGARLDMSRAHDDEVFFGKEEAVVQRLIARSQRAEHVCRRLVHTCRETLHALPKCMACNTMMELRNSPLPDALHWGKSHVQKDTARLHRDIARLRSKIARLHRGMSLLHRGISPVQRDIAPLQRDMTPLQSDGSRPHEEISGVQGHMHSAHKNISLMRRDMRSLLRSIGTMQMDRTNRLPITPCRSSRMRGRDWAQEAYLRSWLH
jgi:hypothetical protein